MLHVQFHTLCCKCSSTSLFPRNRKENLKYHPLVYSYIKCHDISIYIFWGELFVASSFLFRFTDISLNFVSRTLRRLFLFKHSEIKYPVAPYSFRKSTIYLVCMRTTLSCSNQNEMSRYSVHGKQNITPNINC